MTIVILTRPRAASEAFLARLRQAGTTAPAIIAPIIEIVPEVPDRDPGHYPLLFFTSMNAVAALGARPDLAGRLAWCVGPATAEAAKTAGFRTRAAAGDAESLIAQVLAERRSAPEELDGPALHLRGRHARGAVAARLTAAGLPTDETVVYDQHALPLSAEARDALGGGDPVLLPLFSPRSAALVAEAGPVAAPLTVVAMSEAVAASWTRGGRVVVADAPEGEAMLSAVLRSLQV